MADRVLKDLGFRAFRLKGLGFRHERWFRARALKDLGKSA